MPASWRLPFGYSISVLLITVTLASTFHRTIAFVVILLIILTTPFAMIIPTNAQVGPIAHEPPATIDEVLIPPKESAHDPEEPEPESDFEMELRCVCLHVRMEMLWITLNVLGCVEKHIYISLTVLPHTYSGVGRRGCLAITSLLT